MEAGEVEVSEHDRVGRFGTCQRESGVASGSLGHFLTDPSCVQTSHPGVVEGDGIAGIVEAHTLEPSQLHRLVQNVPEGVESAAIQTQVVEVLEFLLAVQGDDPATRAMPDLQDFAGDGVSKRRDIDRIRSVRKPIQDGVPETNGIATLRVPALPEELVEGLGDLEPDVVDRAVLSQQRGECPVRVDILEQARVQNHFPKSWRQAVVDDRRSPQTRQGQGVRCRGSWTRDGEDFSFVGAVPEAEALELLKDGFSLGEPVGPFDVRDKLEKVDLGEDDPVAMSILERDARRNPGS